ncbi:MAG: hypothetical protein LBL74_02825 [Bacteroidales bacterium]|jgi:hypothetical protein|nr:hypothetical protein [Bacteroidales bacterium]
MFFHSDSFLTLTARIKGCLILTKQPFILLKQPFVLTKGCFVFRKGNIVRTTHTNICRIVLMDKRKGCFVRLKQPFNKLFGNLPAVIWQN